MRKFEMVSDKQIKIDFGEEYGYGSRELFIDRFQPRRATKYSAAYDLYAPFSLTLKPGEIAKIPVGFKIKMPRNEGFFIYSRSSYSLKDVVIPAGVNIIDADYYNNPDNEGDFFIVIKNNGKEKFNIVQGDRIAQGVFQKYYKVKGEKVTAKRAGGFGSSGTK